MHRLALVTLLVAVAWRLDTNTGNGVRCYQVETGELGNTRQVDQALSYLRTSGTETESLVTDIQRRERRQAGRRRNRNGSKRRNKKSSSCLEVSGINWRSYHSSTVINK